MKNKYILSDYWAAMHQTRCRLSLFTPLVVRLIGIETVAYILEHFRSGIGITNAAVGKQSSFHRNIIAPVGVLVVILEGTVTYIYAVIGFSAGISKNDAVTLVGTSVGNEGTAVEVGGDIVGVSDIHCRMIGTSHRVRNRSGPHRGPADGGVVNVVGGSFAADIERAVAISFVSAAVDIEITQGVNTAMGTPYITVVQFQIILSQDALGAGGVGTVGAGIIRFCNYGAAGQNRGTLGVDTGIIQALARGNGHIRFGQNQRRAGSGGDANDGAVGGIGDDNGGLGGLQSGIRIHCNGNSRGGSGAVAVTGQENTAIQKAADSVFYMDHGENVRTDGKSVQIKDNILCDSQSLS